LTALFEYADADTVVVYSDVILHKSMCKDKKKIILFHFLAYFS